jgi:5-methyltetrahydropteroyltriglutamate--homocysteine methyltransferase
MIWARMDGQDVDEGELQQQIEAGVADVVARQRAAGIDVVSDGELSKTGFSTYVNERFSGFDGRSEFQADDVADFPKLAMRLFNTPSMAHIVFSNCVGPVELRDKQAVHQDVDRLKRALGDADPGTAFMGAISPGQIAFNYPDQHYGSHEAYLGALADALSYEYRAIADAGFKLQIDSPDMAMAAHCRSVGSSVGDWHHHLPLAVDALNAALEGHAHEWRVFEQIDLPDDKSVILGVIDVKANCIEHPRLVADRLVQLGRIVGSDRVIGGTDCGFDTFIRFSQVDPDVAWLKLQSLAQGAEIASGEL